MAGDDKLKVGDELDTSNWKTYRNEKYGFELKYPPDFSVSENFETQGNIITSEFVISRFFNDYDVSIGVYTLFGADFAIPTQKTFEVDNPGTVVTSETDINIDGVDGKRLVMSGPGAGNEVGVYVINNKRLYGIGLNHIPSKEPTRSIVLKLFAQILSTFKFLK